jgi:hypothetical protein
MFCYPVPQQISIECSEGKLFPGPNQGNGKGKIYVRRP